MRKSRLLSIPCLLIGLMLLNGCVPHNTGSTEVGVRTVKWSLLGEVGVVDQVFAPGATYFFMPFINDWHTFDTKIQNMEMTFSTIRGDRKSRDDLLFKTIDGNDISLDVIISYRIDPAKVVQLVQNIAVTDINLKEIVIRPATRSILRDIFGELKTEEFYIAERRSEKAEKAVRNLNERLNPMGIIVEKVLTKDYRFNPAYQKAIEDKKIADQKVEQNKSAARAALEEYREKLAQSLGTYNQMVAEVDGQYEQTVLETDAYYEHQAKIAEAIRAEGIAQAKGITKMREALSGSGGETMVRLKVAEALQGKKIILLPLGEASGMDLKTLDINDLLKVRGLKSLENK